MGAPDILQCVEVEPQGGVPVGGAVIWLHGLGADGHDFEPIVPYLGLDEDRGGVRFVFPHAPKRPVALNMGLIMRAWYDIRAIDLRRDHDVEGIADSAERIRALIARENGRGIPTDRIVLSGFSQGGAMALQTGLRHSERLAGILALSGFLPLPGTVAAEASPANRDVPIFMAHGSHDPLVPLARAREAYQLLTRLGYRVEWHEYPIPHSVSDAEIRDVAAWLTRILA